MIDAIIIDDELKGRVSLRKKLQDYCPEVNICGEAANGIEGIHLIEQKNPSLIFLDIEMPLMNGFEMLHQLSHKNFHIIFTTAYDQYAIKAIKFSAFDYLLKPIDIEELKLAIQRVTEQTNLETEKKLAVLKENTSGKNDFNKIVISTMNGALFFNIPDILHLEAQSNYTTLYFKDNPKLIASRTLREFEELLPLDTFFRIHHSHLINLNYIKRYIKGDGGQIEMQNGNFVEVSRRKKEEFLKRIGLKFN